MTPGDESTFGEDAKPRWADRLSCSAHFVDNDNAHFVRTTGDICIGVLTFSLICRHVHPQMPLTCFDELNRQRFSEARVLVFGSSAMSLSTPESDIDLTLYLPTRVELMQELKVRNERTRSLSLSVTLR